MKKISLFSLTNQKTSLFLTAVLVEIICTVTLLHLLNYASAIRTCFPFTVYLHVKIHSNILFLNEEKIPSQYVGNI